MKKIVNILCVIILIILVTMLALSVCSFGMGFGKGVSASDDMFNSGDAYGMENVYMSPDTEKSNSFFPDSLELSDGEKIPMIVQHAIVCPPEMETDHGKFFNPLIVNTILILTYLAFMVVVVVKFIKFIININKDRIFVVKNVRLIKQMGIWLLVAAAVYIVYGILGDIRLAGLHLSPRNYVITADWNVPWSNIILGLLALLISEIWKMAFKMKEEQELTI